MNFNCIVCTRIGNVRILRCSEEEEDNCDKLKRIFKEKDNNLEFLLVYYTGHTLAGSDYLERCLEPVEVRRLLCIIDCCFADQVRVSPQTKDCSRIVLRSSERFSKASPIAGSTFTRFYLAGLRSAVRCPCEQAENCQYLKRFRECSLASGFVTLANLFEYTAAHMKDQKPRQDISTYRRCDPVLAFFNAEPIVYTLKLRQNHKTSDIEIEEQKIDFSTNFQNICHQLRQEISYLPLYEDSEDGRYDSASDLTLYTLDGTRITDVSVLKEALKKGHVVISLTKTNPQQ